jgi:hypothetical protein
MAIARFFLSIVDYIAGQTRAELRQENDRLRAALADAREENRQLVEVIRGLS